ncbi:hypothetical protein ACFV2X_37885 [Streptomyces sp. NPDC059679]|uniref:hypothetical protein n=1 Tax=Streptomyces sp. NPDC059679 TaxID=3346903 RepID=UPI00368E4FE3
MTASKAKQAQVALRRTRHLELAMAGLSNDEIAAELGMASRGAASKELCRILEKAQRREALAADQYRMLHRARLTKMLAGLWDKAIGGQDLQATEAVRKIIADLRKLDGVDEPEKTELSGPGGGAIPIRDATAAELHRLIGIAGDDEPDGDDHPDDADDEDEAEEDLDEDQDDDGDSDED